MSTDSVAQTLATGTQDLAALAGLFCADGVERNALAVQFGYLAVASSALSLLGVLGLVRSSIKVALGLVRCLNAGFNVDSVRGLFGFLPSEATASSDMIECDFVNVDFAKTPVRDLLSVPPRTSIVSRLKTRIGSWSFVVSGSQNEDYDHLVIRKTHRFFDRRLTPIVGIGNSRTWTEPLQRLSVVNLGYLRHEKIWAQSGILIGFLIVLCSGITCWLLMLTVTRWNWVTILAIPGFHISLCLLLALPIWHERSMNRPGSRLTIDAWNLLTTGSFINNSTTNAIKKRNNMLSLLQARVEGGDVLHLQSNRTFLDSNIVQGLILIPAVMAAVGYVCQYTILKGASNKAALIWIGCQGALALPRVGCWVLDPEFNNQSGSKTECAFFNNAQFGPLSLIELICACSSSEDGTKIPRWVWEYLRITGFKEMMQKATPDTIKPTEKLRGYYLMLGVDFERIIDNRSKTSVSWDKSFIWRLGLEKRENDEIHPFIFIEMPCMTRRPRETFSSPISLKSTRPWLDDCWTKASMANEVLLQNSSLANDGSEWMIKEPCKIFVANKQGLRVHLLPLDHSRQCSDGCTPQQDASLRLLKFREDKDSWRDIYGRSKDACEHIKERVTNLEPLASNKWCDALWTVTTPGTIDRRGRLASPVKPLRTYGNGNNLEMREAAAFVGWEFIQLGLQEFAGDATVVDVYNFRSPAKENAPENASITEIV